MQKNEVDQFVCVANSMRQEGHLVYGEALILSYEGSCGKKQRGK